MAGSDLLAKFAALGARRIERLNNLVVELEQGGDRASLGREAQREIHTLKGEARILGLDRTAALAHGVEEVLHRALAHEHLPPDAVRFLLEGVDRLAALVAAGPRGGDGDVEGDAAWLAQSESVAAAAERGARAGETPAAPTPFTAESDPRGALPVPQPRDPARGGGVGGGTVGRGSASVYVDGAQLGEMTRLLGELRGLDARWRGVASTLRTIDERLRAERRRRGSGAGGGELDAGYASERAHDEIRELARAGYAAARAQIFEYETLLGRLGQLAWSLRVLPVDAQLRRHPRAVRDLSRALGKSVRLEIVEHGARVERPVLDMLDEVAVHLLRNAVDHGIEAPDERARAGKEPTGRVTLAVRPLGAQVELVVEDDGRGIDPAALRRAAVARRVLSPEGADEATDEEMIELLFAPGFTTRAEVSETSGRGVGLDTVRERAAALGGLATVESVPGRGTTFRVVVPTLATVSSVLVVSAAGTQIAIPSQAVESVVSVPREEVETSGTNAFIRRDGEPLALLDLALSMGEGADAPPSSRGTIEAVLVQHQRGVRAYRVDRVVGERQAVQIPPGRFLADHPFVRSMSLLDDGDLALCVDVAALAGSRAQAHVVTAPRDPAAAAARAAASAAPRILVVDDSELTRDVVAGFLRDAGFDVTEAVNGREALERIGTTRPDLLVTDLQMPVMDGFELVRTVRDSPRWRELPIIVVSTLGSEADRQQAARLGADAYVVKSDLRRHVMLDVVSRFVRRAGPGAGGGGS